MAEYSSVNLNPEPSYEKELLDSELLTVMDWEPSYERYQIILDEDSDHLLHLVRKLSSKPIELNDANSEDVGRHQSYMQHRTQFSTFPEDNIKPSFFEFTRVNENGLIDIDIKKLERKFCSLNLDGTTEKDPSQKEIDVQPLRTKVLESLSEKDDEHSDDQTETDKGNSIEDKTTEKFTAFKYEKQNKLWDRKPHLREIAKEFLLQKFYEVNFTEQGLETFSQDVINHIELELNCALNILRRIAYPKLCEKHFSSKFPCGAFIEDEPVENTSISVDHFEFLHEELPENIWDLFEQDDRDWKKNPKINNMVPLFIKFFESDEKFQFSENCLSLILAILKNPYRKIEVFDDYELPVVNEQKAIAEYLLNCFQISKILDDKSAYKKLAESIISFANIHPSFLAVILEGFNVLLSDQINEKIACQIYCRILNLMTSIGATIIDLCLPLHFEKISCLAAGDQNCDLYFHLLRACEISIANAIEHESWMKGESSDEIDLVLFYIDCYNYFGWDLATHLAPVFKKYENKKNREEQYLSKKHAIFPTKNGYMNMEIQFLRNRCKHRAGSESSSSPKIKKCTFNSPAKVLCSSSNSQLGYIIEKDLHELSFKDIVYQNIINEFALSCFEDINW